tara:strand:- start:333 stop:659 length:327 start_codon:yes stop_codon:yes gene_type:complete
MGSPRTSCGESSSLETFSSHDSYRKLFLRTEETLEKFEKKRKAPKGVLGFRKGLLDFNTGEIVEHTNVIQKPFKCANPLVIYELPCTRAKKVRNWLYGLCWLRLVYWQ